MAGSRSNQNYMEENAWFKLYFICKIDIVTMQYKNDDIQTLYKVRRKSDDLYVGLLVGFLFNVPVNNFSVMAYMYPKHVQ